MENREEIQIREVSEPAEKHCLFSFFFFNSFKLCFYFFVIIIHFLESCIRN